MRLLRVFVTHEALTQYRSLRFRVVASIYVVGVTVPTVVIWLVADTLSFHLGGAAYAGWVAMTEAPMTSLFLGAISTDALIREREEGSFSVISLAPLSSIAYVLLRWLAVLAVALPITLVPRVIGYALATQRLGAPPSLSPFVLGWLINVLPVALVVSALMLTLATITGRSVLALIALAAFLSFGVGFLNDFLAKFHRDLSSPADFFGLDASVGYRIVWTAKGYFAPHLASDAGFPTALELEYLFPRAALLASLTIFLLGVSPLFLKRARPDVRPWRIDPNHPLRSFHRTLNRIRDEYTPDAGRETADRIALVVGLIAAVAIFSWLLRRETHFQTLAAERYRGEKASEPLPTPVAVVAQAIEIEAGVDKSVVHSRTTFRFHNRGDRAESHFGFALNPGLAIERATMTGRKTAITRAWERVGIDVAPPLAAGETAELTLQVRGEPAQIEFSLHGGPSFEQRYRRYLKATDSVELSDLTRSITHHAATDVRVALHADDLAPVPRYTPWLAAAPPMRRRWQRHPTFVPEVLAAPASVAVKLRVPDGFVAADSCGTLSDRATLASRCTFPFANYRVYAARLKTMPLSAASTLAYLPPHEELIRQQLAAIAEAPEIAQRAWPGLGVSSEKVVFFERPTEPEEDYLGDFLPAMAMRSIDSSGSLHLLSELMLMRKKPADSRIIAAAIVSNELMRRRRVVPHEQAFFTQFFNTLARSRVGGETTSPVAAGVGMRPFTDPLLSIGDQEYRTQRLRAVISSLEHRVGSDRVTEGINDFLAAGPAPGTAKELLDAIARRASVNLDRVYTDYFTGKALPVLTFVDVAFRRTASGWEVSGKLHNKGTGEVFCPVVLRTKAGSIRRELRVDEKHNAAFTIVTPYEPRTLQIDPERVIYRLAEVGAVESIDYRGDQ